jgi:hypothetical protein
MIQISFNSFLLEREVINMPYTNPEIIIDNDLNNAESSKHLTISVTAEMWADLMHHTHEEFSKMSGVVNDLAVDSTIGKINEGGSQNIELMADTDFTAKPQVVVKSGSTVTLDIGGKKATFGNGPKSVSVAGELVIEDSDGSGLITSNTPYDSNNSKGVIALADGGKVTMNSGDIEVAMEDPVNQGQFGITASNKDAQVEINGGKIRAGWYAISTNGTASVTGTKMTVNGGELISIADYAVYAPARDGVVVINGGVIRGAAGALCARGGSITINGGELSSLGNGDTGTWSDGTGGTGNAVLNLPANYAPVTVEINGGIFTAPEGTPVIVKGANATVVIKGGTFSSNVSEYVADGYECVMNSQNLYEVREASDDTVVGGDDVDPGQDDAPVEDPTNP